MVAVLAVTMAVVTVTDLQEDTRAAVMN
jgi:hypothetical protein